MKYIIDSFNSLPEWDITEFTVPSSVDTLDSSFNDIDNLRKVTLPDNAITLSNVFNNSPIDTIVCLSPEPYPIEYICFNDANKSECIVKVPKGSLEAYKEAPLWSEFANIIEEDLSGVEQVSTGDAGQRIPIRIDGTVFRESDHGLYIIDGKKYIKP